VLNKTPPNIPSGVVIAVQLLSAFQALELVTVTVVLVRESTLPVTTPLAGVGRSHVIYVDTVFFGFVFDVPLEFTERPLLELVGVRNTLADMLQILERNRRAIVLRSFSNECF
jgi:hypothetical protein